MLFGAHFHQTITEAGLDLFKKGGFGAAKLLWYHTADDVALIKKINPDTHFMLRLPDSINDDGTMTSWQAYAARCAQIINTMLRAGVDTYEMDNEPNITWSGKRLYDANLGHEREVTPDDYQWFLGKAYEELRQLIPARVRIGTPALSWSAEHRPLFWLAHLRGVMERFDFICTDCYWQAHTDIASKDFGGSFQLLHDWFADKQIVVAEWGNTHFEKIRPVPAQGLASLQAVDYPTWLSWTRTLSYLDASYLFAITEAGWEHLQLTIAGALAIGRLTHPHRPQGGAIPT
jgi:hypothetical protein